MEKTFDVGTLIEVRKTIFPAGGDQWILSRVTGIFDDHGSFSVESLREPFDQDGHKFMMLRFSDREKGWR